MLIADQALHGQRLATTPPRSRRSPAASPAQYPAQVECPCRDRSRHSLPRSRRGEPGTAPKSAPLLRQPGGFEGTGSLVELELADAEAVVERQRQGAGIELVPLPRSSQWTATMTCSPASMNSSGIVSISSGARPPLPHCPDLVPPPRRYLLAHLQTIGRADGPTLRRDHHAGSCRRACERSPRSRATSPTPTARRLLGLRCGRGKYGRKASCARGSPRPLRPGLDLETTLAATQREMSEGGNSCRGHKASDTTTSRSDATSSVSRMSSRTPSCPR